MLHKQIHWVLCHCLLIRLRVFSLPSHGILIHFEYNTIQYTKYNSSRVEPTPNLWIVNAIGVAHYCQGFQAVAFRVEGRMMKFCIFYNRYNLVDEMGRWVVERTATTKPIQSCFLANIGISVSFALDDILVAKEEFTQLW